MFTGLVETSGNLVARRRRASGSALWLSTPVGFNNGIELGDSICVNGTCLTALDIRTDGFRVDVSDETLNCTTLGSLPIGAGLNLEKSLRPSDRLGGHFVTGHVDCQGKVVARELVQQPAGNNSERWVFSAPSTISRLIAAKGSIAIDGVSLTVNAVDGARFEVQLIPHTLAVTTLGQLKVGDAVNLEADLLARYLLRWRETGGSLDDPLGPTDGPAGSSDEQGGGPMLA